MFQSFLKAYLCPPPLSPGICVSWLIQVDLFGNIRSQKILGNGILFADEQLMAVRKGQLSLFYALNEIFSLGKTIGINQSPCYETLNRTLRTLTRHLLLLLPYVTSKGLVKLSHGSYNPTYKPTTSALLTNLSLLCDNY